VSPDHFAAHHYLVHSHEMIGRIDDALVHGEAYVRLAPGVPHAHHMWAHDLRRVGRTRDAIAEFRKADALENAYYAAEGIPAELDWHHQHNLDLLATSHQHQGQMREAEALMRRSFGMPPPYEYSAFNKKSGRFPVELRPRHGGAKPRRRWSCRVSPRRARSATSRWQAAFPWLARRGARERRREREFRYRPVSGPRATRSALLRPGQARQPAASSRPRAVRGRRPAAGAANPTQDAGAVRAESVRTAREASDSELAERIARQMLERPAYAGGIRSPGGRATR
jgi:hypothetical protein